MKKVTRILALALSVVMCLSLVVGCGKKDGGNSGAKDTLVVGYSPFSSKFSPFFSETAYDQDVYTMTALGLLTSDRTGAIVEKGIKGETRSYNGTDYTYYGPADMTVTENPDGTVYYDVTMRDDIQFSDGTTADIDDVIFSMYVFADPTYDGSVTFYSCPIEGMEDYRNGMGTLAALLAEAGEDNTDFTNWTEDQQKAYVMPCAVPINDKYRTDEQKYKEPDAFYQGSRIAGRIGITEALEDKSEDTIAALFTFLDWMYTREGALTSPAATAVSPSIVSGRVVASSKYPLPSLNG